MQVDQMFLESFFYIFRYWKHVTTPYFLISSQYDPTYFDTNPCGPGDSDPQYAAYQLSWRRGTIALTQVK